MKANEVIIKKSTGAIDTTIVATMTSGSSTGFGAWLTSVSLSPLAKKKYAAFISSPYIGLIMRIIMGWEYNTVADCKNSPEIINAIDVLSVKGTLEKEFADATYGNALSALGKYRDYLISIGR